jgi:hypothetical protein
LKGDWRSVFAGKEKVRMRDRAGRESNPKEKTAEAQKEARSRTEQEATNSGTHAELLKNKH